MDELSKFILDFFRNKDGKRSYLGLIILILFGFLLNYLFGFSDQYKFEKKIENLKSIENLLKDHNIDKNLKFFLNEKKNNIITEIKFNENEIYLIPKNEVKIFLDFRTFHLIHYISSSWLFILLIIYFPIGLIRRKTILPGTFFMSRLLTISMLILTTYILSILYSNLLEFVPIFSFKHLWFNYVFNFFSIFFVITFLFFGYSVINYGSKYAELPEKNPLKTHTKQEIFDPFANSALGEVIGEKNPLLWAGEIIKYNFKKNNTIFNIFLCFFLLISWVFLIYSVFYTLYSLILK